jgi:hypothetical protein
MNTEPSPLGGFSGIDLDFVHRVYRTSAVVTALLAVFLWESKGRPSALGLLLGAALSLLIIAGLEWSVRRYIQPESRSPSALIVVSLLKLLVAALVLVLAFVGATRGWIALPWVLLGFALPHVVAALKLVGQRVVARNPRNGPERSS